MAHSRYYIVNEHGRREQVPSVTTILNILSKGRGLDIWIFRQGQASVFEALDTLVQRSLDKAADTGGDEEKLPASRLLHVLPPVAENQFEVGSKEADIGDCTHAMVECDLRGLDFPEGAWKPDVLAKSRQLFEEGWLPWKRQNQFELLDCEAELTSAKMKYGGRLDMAWSLCSCQGERHITDLKTTKKAYFEHLVQVVAYGALWEENHPDQPIDRYSVLRLSKVDGAVEFKQWHKDSEGVRDAAMMFALCRQLYTLKRKHS